MIEVTNINGQRHFLARKAVARVIEASPSSQWHGIKAFVKLFDGGTLEVRESAQMIAGQIDGEPQGIE